jgi:hypothetical protein
MYVCVHMCVQVYACTHVLVHMCKYYVPYTGSPDKISSYESCVCTCPCVYICAQIGGERGPRSPYGMCAYFYIYIYIYIYACACIAATNGTCDYMYVCMYVCVCMCVFSLKLLSNTPELTLCVLESQKRVYCAATDTIKHAYTCIQEPKPAFTHV